MIFFSGAHFEEEEEESGDIDDALLVELGDDTLDDDLLDGELDPLAKVAEISPLSILDDEEELDKDSGDSEDDDEEDMDYDSFDDHDEM
jgi:hypothetical protein